MELMDYRRLYTCDKMSIVHDHKDNHKVVGQNSLAVTNGQFCPMFYHVAERERETKLALNAWKSRIVRSGI